MPPAWHSNGFANLSGTLLVDQREAVYLLLERGAAGLPATLLSPWDFRSSLFLASSVLALWGLGRALRQKRLGAWLFGGLVLTYPTVYYFVFPRLRTRYRHPIEPELLILAVFLFCEVRRRDTGASPESL